MTKDNRHGPTVPARLIIELHSPSVIEARRALAGLAEALGLARDGNGHHGMILHDADGPVAGYSIVPLDTSIN
jgi:hypothetical protein